eukprot:scaffold20.g7836.t1
MASLTSVAIAQLVRQTKPDRLLIEPSALVDILTGGHLRSSLELCPIVCLVDATRFADGTAAVDGEPGQQLFRDQISIAQVLVGSKADLCDDDTLARFQAWGAQLYPPKQRLVVSANGQVDPAALGISGISWPPHQADDLSGAGGSDADAPGGSTSGADAAPDWLAPGPGPGCGHAWLSNAPAAVGTEPCVGQPVRKVARVDTEGTVACGWLFSAEDRFCQELLQGWLNELAAYSPLLLRLKGVFRVGPKTWVAANHVTGHSAAPAPAAPVVVQLEEISYRGSSRLEMILAATGGGGLQGDTEAAGAQAAAALRSGTAGEWAALERSLQGVLAPG